MQISCFLDERRGQQRGLESDVGIVLFDINRTTFRCKKIGGKVIIYIIYINVMHIKLHFEYGLYRYVREVLDDSSNGSSSCCSFLLHQHRLSLHNSTEN